MFLYSFITNEKEFNQLVELNFPDQLVPKPQKYPCVLSIAPYGIGHSFHYMYMDNPVFDMIIKHKKSVEDSWIGNPDRSGGQFTQEEINRSKHWI